MKQSVIDEVGLGETVISLYKGNPNQKPKTIKEIKELLSSKYEIELTESSIFRYIKNNEGDNEIKGLERVSEDIMENAKVLKNNIDDIKNQMYIDLEVNYRAKRRYDNKFNQIYKYIDENFEKLNELLSIKRYELRWLIRDNILHNLVRLQDGCCPEDKEKYVKAMKELIKTIE